MRMRWALPSLALAGLSLVGCVSKEELKKVEQELGDLKLEIFKLRREAEDQNKRLAEEQVAATEARGLDRRFQADLQETLRQLQESTRVVQNRLGSASVSRPQVRANALGNPEPTVPASEEDKVLGSAKLDYNRGNYPLAAESLELFLKSYPQSSLRPEALFFLGLCHYNTKEYDKAMPEFDRILKEHASSAQFLPSKLKRAQCLLKMGLKPAAAKALKDIADGFPGTAEARTAQQELGELQ